MARMFIIRAYAGHTVLFHAVAEVASLVKGNLLEASEILLFLAFKFDPVVGGNMGGPYILYAWRKYLMGKEIKF